MSEVRTDPTLTGIFFLVTNTALAFNRDFKTLARAPLFLALRIDDVAAVNIWDKLAGWFVVGFIASLFFSFLGWIRRKQLSPKSTSLSRGNAESAVSSVPLSEPANSMKAVARALDQKCTPTPTTAMRNHGSDKARTGLQVMNGLFLLFCGYILLTGHSGFVSDLLDFVFVAAFALGFLAAGNPKHDTKRKLAKWSNIAAAALALLILLASATAGATTTGLIAGISLGVPALVNIWACWKGSHISHMGLFDIFSSKKRVIADIDRGIDSLKMPIGILLFRQYAPRYAQAAAASLAAAVTNELFGEPPTHQQGAAFLQTNRDLIQSELSALSRNSALCDIVSIAAHLKANAAGNTGTLSQAVVLWGVRLRDAGILRSIEQIRMPSSINEFYQQIREFETSTM